MSAESVALRIELKSWESEFKKRHGRKPTPDDIRAGGLADKYKRWRALNKEETVAPLPVPVTVTVPVTPPRPSGSKPAEPTSVDIKRTRPTAHDRDAEPATAKVNPFSPGKRRPVASTSPSIPARLNLVFPPPPPCAGTSIAHESDNPFSAAPLSTTSLHPDSPFTKARKRLRGEDVEMADPVLLLDKKRLFLNRSRSASQSTIWSKGGSAANALRADPSRRRRQQQQSEDVDGEELGPSPRKEDRYRPIFNDSSPPAPSPASALGNPLSRTNSLATGMLLFGKKKGDLSRRMEKIEEGHVQLPSPSPFSAGTAHSGKRKRSGSGTGPEFEVVEVQSASAGPVALLGLLPPSPPPAKENEQQQQQQQPQPFRWKGKGKSVASKGKKKAKIVLKEGTSGEEEEDNTVEELTWKPVGPLKRRSRAADIIDAEPDLELEDPTIIAHSRAKLVVTVEEPEQEGDFKIDLPDQLKDLLALTPSKRRKEDEETIVRNLLAGKGGFHPKVEIWAAGEVPEAHGDDDDDDDWVGEPVGWWEAEL